MTSASGLFSNWRSRAGRVSGPDSESDPHVSRPFVSDRDPLPVRRCRRGSSRRRYDAGVSNRFHSDHVSGSEVDGSSIGSTHSSNRHDSMRFTRNERLPNTVIQARERVSERLRGVSLVGSRTSLSWDETEDNVFRVVDLRNRGLPREQHELTSNYIDTSVELYEPSYFPDVIFTNKRPPGLTKEEFDLLELEFFKIEGEKGDVSASLDCSICLENFYDGIEVVMLHCSHRFHPNCLEPWVKKCGDCPYCRTTILS
ncbi:E3 ubiquitin-protein ligase RLIM [Carex littledalei]|uniref:E3 ubiquitin-protein ligase RLIM n=1 Tax=Carex littledalei TaxID=544730 RepID=A0A833VBJ5_9POAL|nr:E3 ubiquitin-protein ligase RLIM [Carex littledalei]